ncbi:MAG: cyclase family protein [Saprospiraceae bacterium]|nr:cyclase family protein [Saprospiraceae bacterium]
MKITLSHLQNTYTIDLSHGWDISIPLKSGAKGPKCFDAPDFSVLPVVSGSFIGCVDQGSAVNFKNIFINPHGNGTHTECAGHITSEKITIHECLKEFHFVARVVTVVPEVMPEGDLVITKDVISKVIDGGQNTIVVRTLPNPKSKLTKDYTGTNPPYFSEEAILYLNQVGICHLITDLPSIDKEHDGGALAGHKAFWHFPDNIDKHKTITEMVYVPDEIDDDFYFCNIQILSIESDASPSKILLYRLEQNQ